jgi:hypothetical protein
MPITRRRLLATSGAGLAGTGAVTLLAACGTDEEEPSAERDVELLNTALEAELAVADLYRSPPSLSMEGAEAATSFGAEAKRQVQQLTEAIEAAGGTPSESAQEVPQAESVIEAGALALNSAIAAYHSAAGALSTPELNRMVIEFVTANAAEVAALRGVLGEDQAPQAFLTGLDEAPLVAEEAT